MMGTLSWYVTLVVCAIYGAGSSHDFVSKRLGADARV